MFTLSIKGSPRYYLSGALHSCKIYDGETLVRDYVPCKNKNGEVGLWDKVEDVFYGNKGSGEFIGLYNNMPINYTVLNYIYSDGNQYIDTGYKPNNTTKIVLETQWDDYSETTPAQAFFRCKDSTYTYGVMDASNTNNLIWFYYYRSYLGGLNVPVGNKRTIVTDGAKTTIDGTDIIHTEQTFQMTTTLFLFAGNENGTVNYISTGKIFACQMYDNGILIRDYIPIKKPNGVIGLWDKVNALFYANAGTGSFTGG